LLLFQPVALSTKPIDFVQHPIQQRFGSSRWNACSLELPDLAALAVDLNAHIEGLNLVAPTDTLDLIEPK
jgi:hypothetical protein